MFIKIAYVWTILLAITIAWQILELIFYGVILEDMVDTIFGFVLAISLFYNLKDNNAGWL